MARKPDLSNYGWPGPPRRGSGRLYAIAAVLALLAGVIVLVGPERFWWWAPFLDAGMPTWWVPMALMVSAVLLVAAARMRR
jgi:uncharacterized RDD family membrane protein YckC